MSQILKKSEFARLVKISAPAVTKLCKGRLAEAVEGSRIDIEHPAVVAYLKEKGLLPSDEPAAPTDSPKEAGDEEGPDLLLAIERGDKNVSAIADLTLRQAAQLYGTKTKFKDWLQALDMIEGIRGKNLKNDREEGKLIDRDLVKGAVLNLIEGTFRRLLGDAPKTIVQQIYAAAKAGKPMEESEQMVRDLIGSQLTPLKERAIRALREQ